MERKAPGQKVERMRVDHDQGFKILGQKVARWVLDNDHKLRAIDPDVPAALNDRQADNWRPLLAIADIAGGDWPRRARDAALALSAADEDAETIGIQLLGDIKEVLANVEPIWTEDLLKRLHAMVERPWCEFGRARKPISPRQLAGLLKPFGIAARQIWKAEAKVNKNGFAAEQFSEAWTRYLTSKALEATESAADKDFPSSRALRFLEDANPPKATVRAGSRGLEDRSPESGRREELDF
jgi:putative DNA primase/helicase